MPSAQMTALMHSKTEPEQARKGHGRDLHETDMVNYVCDHKRQPGVSAGQDVTAATFTAALGIMLLCWVKDSSLRGR